jgi:prepilin-type processing-associated H-X9-DG protein
MTCRPRIASFALLLFAGLALLPACKKDKAGGGGGDPAPDPVPGPTPPAAAGSDYLAFAHLRAKDIRESAVFAEVKQAFAKAGGTAEWDQVEAEVAKELGGIKPTDIDAVTACLTEFSPRGGPKFVLIVSANKAINKAGVSGLGPRPDARGFHTGPDGMLAHFPDAKTLALVHPDLADRYLGGYAADRAGWPMTADLTRAAAGHTLYAAVNMDKLPAEMRDGPDAGEFAPLLAARTITLTADLKGKTLSVAGRAKFPDAAAAGRARATVQKLLGMAVVEVEQVMTGKQMGDLGGVMPAVKEAHRALKAAKVEVSGSDLTVAGSYTANFDIEAVVAEAVVKVREAAGRMTASNNLKQIGIALHSFSDAYGGPLPVHGVGPKAQPLRAPNDKPLLSWRVAILPFIEQDNLYRQFKLDEPWDSEHNKKLIEQMPKIYAPVNKPGKPGYTHLQMVIGPNALQPAGTRIPASFPDGMSNTIAVVEAAEPVIWTKPDDIMLPGKGVPKDLKKKFGGLYPGGFNVLMWDGSVRFVRDTVSDRTLGLLLDPRDGQVIGDDW